MPFTFSHVAAVIPFRKSKLNFIALAIGAMAPDLSYVFELILPFYNAHTVEGVFVFCLPITLVLWFIFSKYLLNHWAGKFPWLNPQISNSNFFTISISAIIGAFTHIIWDGFTHKHGYFVGVFPILSADFFSVLGKPIQLYNLLQHLSTVVGASILYVSLTNRLSSDPSYKFTHSFKHLFYYSLATAALTLLFSAELIAKELVHLQPANIKMFLANIAFRFLGALLLVIFIGPAFERALVRFLKRFL